MIPIQLRLSGFLSYLEPVELDFTGFDLACISGANGAGKSSLLDAITWALFGQARRRDDELIHTKAKAAEVVFTFSYEENVYRIVRSKPRDKTGILELMILLPDEDGRLTLEDRKNRWKSMTEKSLRETEDRIQKILRLNYETFINASFFLQGKADQFSQQRPSERKNILGSILGLDIWEEFRKRAVDQRKVSEALVAGLDGQLREIEAELSEEPARQARLTDLESSLKHLAASRRSQAETLENLRKLASALAEQRALVEALQRQIQAAIQSHDRTAGVLTARQADLQAYQQELKAASEIEAAYQAWQAARQELDRWERVAAQFRQQQQDRAVPLQVIQAEHDRLVQEQASLLLRLQTTQAAQAEMPALQAQMEQVKDAIKSVESRLAQRSALETEIRQLHQDQADARAENPRLRTEMAELKDRITQLEQVEGAACPLCGQPLTAEHRLALVNDLAQDGLTMGDRYRNNQALLREFEDRLAALAQRLAGLSQAENDLRQAARLEDQLSDRLGQLDRLVQDWMPEDQRLLAEISLLLDEGRYGTEARTRLAEVDAELQSLGYDPASHEAVRQAELGGRAAEAELRKLETARAAMAPLQREVAGLEQQLTEQAAEVASQQPAHAEAAARYAAASAQLPDLDQAESALMDLQEQENRLRMEVGAARQKVDVLDRLRQRQKELGLQREEASRQIGRLKTLERAFSKDGVPALLIEQALPEIETQANQIIERLSGGGMAIRFATQKDFKDKSRDDKKETLDILISDEFGTRDYEMYSGGEAFRINFAIRLALSHVLAQRAGARLQTLIIDEGFGSQDALGRQRLIEAINLVRSDFAKILVITHLDELKEAFPTRIEVEKTIEGSKLRVI